MNNNKFYEFFEVLLNATLTANLESRKRLFTKTREYMVTPTCPNLMEEERSTYWSVAHTGLSPSERLITLVEGIFYWPRPGAHYLPTFKPEALSALAALGESVQTIMEGGITANKLLEDVVRRSTGGEVVESGEFVSLLFEELCLFEARK